MDPPGGRLVLGGNNVRAAILRSRAARPSWVGAASRERSAARTRSRRSAVDWAPGRRRAGRRRAGGRGPSHPCSRRRARGHWSRRAAVALRPPESVPRPRAADLSHRRVGWMTRWAPAAPASDARPREVMVLKHLRSAARRVRGPRGPEPARGELEGLIGAAIERQAAAIRERFRPRIRQILDGVSLRPGNAPERASARKLVEELLDLVVDRGFLRIGDLRDAISRNALKLVRPLRPAAGLVGDRLLPRRRRTRPRASTASTTAARSISAASSAARSRSAGEGRPLAHPVRRPAVRRRHPRARRPPAHRRPDRPPDDGRRDSSLQPGDPPRPRPARAGCRELPAVPRCIRARPPGGLGLSPSKAAFVNAPAWLLRRPAGAVGGQQQQLPLRVELGGQAVPARAPPAPAGHGHGARALGRGRRDSSPSSPTSPHPQPIGVARPFRDGELTVGPDVRGDRHRRRLAARPASLAQPDPERLPRHHGRVQPDSGDHRAAAVHGRRMAAVSRRRAVVVRIAKAVLGSRGSSSTT